MRHVAATRRALANGGVVAYPTEAVWGLGCEPLKQRPLRKGVILIAAEFEQIEPSP